MIDKKTEIWNMENEHSMTVNDKMHAARWVADLRKGESNRPLRAMLAAKKVM